MSTPIPCVILDMESQLNARPASIRLSQFMSPDDAAFIVTACKRHASLLGRNRKLREMLLNVRAFMSSGTPDSYKSNLLEKIESVLAECGKQESYPDDLAPQILRTVCAHPCRVWCGRVRVRLLFLVMAEILFSRKWAMPNADTFSVKPIGEFVRRYLASSRVSVDPFSRDKLWTTHTNDLNPSTEAACYMDAEAFLRKLAADGVKCDLAIFDPPYSPRQISECYKSIGLAVGMKETQSALLYQRVRNALIPILTPDAVVLSFGWNSVGMGKKHGFELIEIMLCCHGGAHNDTICLAERRISEAQATPTPRNFSAVC